MDYKDYLAEKLPPELRDRYKKRRDEAISQQDASFQSPEAVDALKDGQRSRALISGLARAANKFGSVGGDGGAKSTLPETFAQFDAAEKDNYNLKQANYDRASRAEDLATRGMFDVDAQERALTNQARDDAKFEREQGLQRDDDNPNSPTSLQYQSLAKKLLPNGNFAGMSATQLKQQLPVLESAYRIDESRKSRLESARALAASRSDAAEERRLIREERKEDKAALLQEKKQLTELETSIPGYEKTGEAAVRPSDVEKLRKAAATQQTIETQLDELIDLQAKYGDFETGPNGEKMAALSSSIQLKLKELENLGVLNGPDLDILRKQIPDVGSTMFSRNDNTGAKLKQGKKLISDMTKNNLEKSGYRRKEAASQFPKSVRNPKTGETAQVSDANELAEARAEGFTE